MLQGWNFKSNSQVITKKICNLNTFWIKLLYRNLLFDSPWKGTVCLFSVSSGFPGITVICFLWPLLFYNGQLHLIGRTVVYSHLVARWNSRQTGCCICSHCSHSQTGGYSSFFEHISPRKIGIWICEVSQTSHILVNTTTCIKT